MGLLRRCLPCRRRSCVHPEEEAPSAWSRPTELQYHSHAFLLRELESGATRLLRPEFLLQWFYKTKKPLPKRQDLPESAFLDPAKLTSNRPVEIIAVSYCWLSKEHPDPDRYHLETLVRLLELFCKSSYDNAKEMWPLGSLNLNKEGLRERGICFGGLDADVGVFLDWAALYQDKPKGTRTAVQTKLFKEALKSINLWYAHKETIVWCLESLSEGLKSQRASYSDSGWTVFERSVAGILTPSDKLVAICGERRKNLLEGRACDGKPLHHYMELVVDRRGTRSVPLTPEHFNELIDSKIFTDGSDKEQVVKPKYAETFRCVISNARALHLRGLGFDDAQARQLLDLTAAHCKQIIELDLSCNDISQPVELTIGSATMAQLRCLNLTGCGRGAAVPFDVAPMADLVLLKQLELAGTFVCGDVAPLAKLQDLEVLWLTGTKVSGDVGALSKLRFLQRLGLGSTFVSGDMTPLTTVTYLERLGLNETQVYGDLADVGKLKCMVRLGLGGTKVFGDVRGLRALCELQVLDLSRTAVSGDVTNLSHLGSLEVLEMRSTAVSGDVGGLTKLVRLEKLDLSFTGVSGDAVPLSRLRRMRQVDFRRTRVQKGWERMVRQPPSDSEEEEGEEPE